MTPTQQLIREIVDSFIPEYSNIAVFDDDRINGYEIVPAKPFILAKLSQVLESVEREIEREAIDGMNLDEYDQGINRGVRAALLVLKEARDTANKTTI